MERFLERSVESFIETEFNIGMEVQLINFNLLAGLYEQAASSERLRHAFDLRTTFDDSSQRMLNVLLPGTHVPIHRHLKSAETNICIEGCLDVIFYEELPTVTEGGPVHDGEKAIDESQFKETARFRLCPKKGNYGIQIPRMAWHTVEVHELSTVFEAKDGKYGE